LALENEICENPIDFEKIIAEKQKNEKLPNI
jgi:hypothetical protein